MQDPTCPLEVNHEMKKKDNLHAVSDFLIMSRPGKSNITYFIYS